MGRQAVRLEQTGRMPSARSAVGHVANRLASLRTINTTRARVALIIRGGWEEPHPVGATERFIPFLKEHGFEVEGHDGPRVYADADKLAATDLVLPHRQRQLPRPRRDPARHFGRHPAARLRSPLDGRHGHAPLPLERIDDAFAAFRDKPTGFAKAVITFPEG